MRSGRLVSFHQHAYIHLDIMSRQRLGILTTDTLTHEPGDATPAANLGRARRVAVGAPADGAAARGAGRAAAHSPEPRVRDLDARLVRLAAAVGEPDAGAVLGPRGAGPLAPLEPRERVPAPAEEVPSPSIVPLFW